MASEIFGRVTASDGGLYEIYTEDGARISCKPRGKFRHERIRLLVGDRVKVGKDEGGNLSVTEILERRNALIRPPLSGVDRMFVTVAASSPEPLLLNVDKLTAIAEENHIKAVIVVTKCDLDREKAEELRRIYETTGYPVFLTSKDDESSCGLLREYIKNECANELTVFAGASGVGKSTMLNCLFPTLQRETKEVSEKIGRGRHTTRSVTLFPFAQLFGSGKGFLADTPGFSLLDFENFDFFSLEALPYNFREFVCCLGHCRYTKCSHRKEDGCEIIRRVAAGSIAASRHESYRLLYEQLKNKHEWEK